MQNRMFIWRSRALTLLASFVVLCCSGLQKPVEVQTTIGNLLIEAVPVSYSPGDSLTAKVAMTSLADTTMHVGVGGGCPVTLRVYKDRKRRPVWDAQQFRGFSVCAMSLRIVELLPRSTQTFQSRLAVHDILGDSLPSGRYFFEAALQLEQGAAIVSSGELVLQNAR